MSDRFPVFVFRAGYFARNGDSVACAAPLDLVVSVYGGGGLKGEGGLDAAFGGAALFGNDEEERYYLGVWGSRKASRFRRTLREAGVSLEILRAPPPARLIFFTATSGRSRKVPRRKIVVHPKS